MKKHFKTLSSLIILTFVLTIPYFVFAQTSSDSGILNRLDKVAGTGGYNPGGSADITTVVGLIVQAVLGLLGVVFVILMVYAGYTWMIARGNEQKVTKAKDMLQTAIIGLVIVLSSWAIWSFILSGLIG